MRKLARGSHDVILLKLLNFVWKHPLNADHRIAALERVLWWQVVSRVCSEPVGLPFVDGTFLFATKGMTGASGNWYSGLHELQEMAFVLHLLRPTDHFIDAGANVGSYTVLAGGAVGATVTSIEPIPRTFECLRQNIFLNGLEALVNAWQGGLSDSTGTLRFTEDLDTGNHVVVENEPGPTVEVPVKSVDDLVDGKTPVLLKVDVEGYEHRVLCGASRTLADSRLLAAIIETNGATSRYGTSDADVVGLMQQQGFEVYEYDPFARQLLLGTSRTTVRGNTIFVRDRPTVQTRVSAARTYRLVNGQI